MLTIEQKIDEVLLRLELQEIRLMATLEEVQAKITAANEPAAVGAFVTEMTKQKRYLTTEHLEALRSLYEVKRSQVAARVMGEVKKDKE